MLCATLIVKHVIPSIVIGIVLGLNMLGMMASALESLIGHTNFSSYLLVNTITHGHDFNQLEAILHVASEAVVIIFLLLFSTNAIIYKMKEELK